MGVSTVMSPIERKAAFPTVSSKDDGEQADHIPVGWRRTRLGELADVVAGGTPDRGNPRYWNGSIPWATTTEIDYCTIYETAQSITDVGLNNSAAKMFPTGTLLMALYGQGKTRGKVGVLGIEAATNQACAAIVLRCQVDDRYLFHFLASRYHAIRDLSNTGNQENLNNSIVRSIPLLLPESQQEQAAIGETLSDIDRLIESLDALIAKKRAIKQATMQQLLTGKTRLPGFTDPWKEIQVGTLGQLFKGRGIKRDEVLDEGVPCIRYGELYTRYRNYVSSPLSHIAPDTAASSRPVQTGDLLFAGSGETAEEIGTCVAYIGKSVAYAGGDIIVLRPQGFDPVFLGHLMNHPLVALQKARHGQGDAVVHINARHLAQVTLELPRCEEQETIARVALDMDHEITALCQQRDKTRAIKQGMMQQLLTGRIRLVTKSEEVR